MCVQLLLFFTQSSLFIKRLCLRHMFVYRTLHRCPQGCQLQGPGSWPIFVTFFALSLLLFWYLTYEHWCNAGHGVPPHPHRRALPQNHPQTARNQRKPLQPIPKTPWTLSHLTPHTSHATDRREDWHSKSTMPRHRRNESFARFILCWVHWLW